MNDLCRSGGTIALMIRCDRTHQTVLDEDISMIPEMPVTIAECKQLCPTRWLSARDVDEKQKPFEKGVDTV